jgi:hypothetical protein
MHRALKINVNVGKDHIIKLPSEFPEGPAEVIIITSDRSAAAPGASGIGLWADVDDAEYEAFTGAVQTLRASDKLRSDDE